MPLTCPAPLARRGGSKTHRGWAHRATAAVSGNRLFARATRWAANLAAVLALAAGGTALAQTSTVQPGILYAVGEKFDRSFNENAFGAMQRFEADYGLDFLEYLPQAVSEFDAAIAAMAERGTTHIICVGFYWAEPLARLAADYADIRFVLIDGVVDAPNVQSITFREQEGSFLAGVMAAHASLSGRIGFVAALDIPLLRKFSVGFEEGAAWVDPEIDVLFNPIGDTPAAFADPSTGKEVALSQIDRGADVIFAGAGSSNFGIFQAAQEEGVLAIGVDSNQNYLHPGTILTSMEKRVDVAVYGALEAAWAGEFNAGHVTLGLREGGVDVAIDRHNAPLLSEAMEADLDRARLAIESGEIVVTDPTAAP